MRGSAFPIMLAVVFGVMNGIYTFKPTILEAVTEREKARSRKINSTDDERKKDEET